MKTMPFPILLIHHNFMNM